MASPKKASNRVVDPLDLTNYFKKVLKSVEEDSRITSAAEDALQAMTSDKIKNLTSGAIAISRNRDKGKQAPKEQKEARHGTLLARDLATAVEVAFTPEFAPEAIDAGEGALIAVEEGAAKGSGKTVTIKSGERAGQTRASPTRREEVIGAVLPVSRIENIMRTIADEAQYYYEEATGRGENKVVVNRELVTGIRVDSEAPIFMTAVIDYALRELLSEAFDVAQERKVKTVDNVDIAAAVARNPTLANLFGAWVLTNMPLFEKRQRAPRKKSTKKKGAAKKKAAPKKKSSVSPRSGGKKAAGSPRSAASDEGEGSPEARGDRDEDEDNGGQEA